MYLNIEETKNATLIVNPIFRPSSNLLSSKFTKKRLILTNEEKRCQSLTTTRSCIEIRDNPNTKRRTSNTISDKRDGVVNGTNHK